MKPRFDIFRALYQRILAKPEALIALKHFRSEPVDCGTPFCVKGELCEMSEARALGFQWISDIPCISSFSIWSDQCEALGITTEEFCDLFQGRQNYNITDKSEALARIEKLFADHGEELHLPDSIEYARRDEVVA